MEVTISLSGVSEAADKLQNFERKVVRRIVDRAIRRGAKPIVNTLRRNAPKRTGIFARSLTMKMKTYPSSGTVVAIVGQKKQQTRKARRSSGGGGISGRGEVVPIHFVENPIKPHDFQRRSKARTLAGLKRFLNKNKNAEQAEVVTARLPLGFRRLKLSRVHPGTRGTRFVQRSFAESDGFAIQEFNFVFVNEVNSAAASMPGG